jgi:cell wall-associated NlpC family hydrolase
MDDIDRLLAALIGAPYAPMGRGPDSFDCWGFVKHIYKALGIDLPEFVYTEDGRTKTKVFESERLQPRWEEIESPEPYCLVALGKLKTCSHVGIWHPSGDIVHALDVIGVRFHTVERLALMGNRYLKFYRYTG